MGMLNCHTTCKITTTITNSNEYRKEEEDSEFVSRSMTIFSTKLFLEQLSPPFMDPFTDDEKEDDAESKTVHDRMDVVVDLISMLSLESNTTTTIDQPQQQQAIRLKELSNAVLKEFSEVLIRSRKLGFEVISACAAACTGGNEYVVLASRINEIVVSTAPSLRHRWGEYVSTEDRGSSRLIPTTS